MASRALRRPARQPAQRRVDVLRSGKLARRGVHPPGLRGPPPETGILILAREQVRDRQSFSEPPGDERLLDDPEIVEVHAHVITRLDGILEVNRRSVPGLRSKPWDVSSL